MAQVQRNPLRPIPHDNQSYLYALEQELWAVSIYSEKFLDLAYLDGEIHMEHLTVDEAVKLGHGSK